VAWNGLLFYEELDRRPPLHLRWLLPVPLRSEGRVVEAGDEVKCWYEQGLLRKRFSHIERGKSCEFEIVEQALRFRGDLRISGGRYMLRELADGTTEVAMETRFQSSRRPRWFWKPLERLVCHAFHRHLLHAIRRKLAATRRSGEPAPGDQSP
jgi:hypothetical protein